MIKTLSDLPAIETKRLQLAPLSLRAAKELQELTDDPVITSAVHFLHSPFTLSDAESLIQQGDDGRNKFIGAWNREDGKLIGTVGAHMRIPNDIEIGYWIANSMQGRGYASEAVQGVVMLLREAFPKMRIIAECKPANAVSWHLLERIGFRSTGGQGSRPGRDLLVFTDYKSAP